MAFLVRPLTGDLYIADVGQNKYEEVNFQPAASAGGRTTVGRIMEGLHCYNAAHCDHPAYLPVTEYSHVEGCSVTGGFVYRGTRSADAGHLLLWRLL